MKEKYEFVDGKMLRIGFTTGTCAAITSKAALKALINRSVESEYESIKTPDNTEFELKLNSIYIGENYAQASIIKDAGDDPDITDGIEIFSKVSFRNDNKINITGGVGVGVYSENSIFGKKGEKAINKTPIEMIEKEVKLLTDRGVNVEIFVPQGQEVAKKTFNPNIGIEGGISIIGTTGVVRPMSEDAFIKTINMELHSLRKDKSYDKVIIVPGSHGKKYADFLNLELPVLMCANYIGDSLKFLEYYDYKEAIFIGHVGKFSKLSIGVFNTHSKYADTRMEAFVYYMAINNCPTEDILKVSEFSTAEQAANYLIENNYKNILLNMQKGAEERCKNYIKNSDIKIKVYMYTFKEGLILC